MILSRRREDLTGEIINIITLAQETQIWQPSLRAKLPGIQAKNGQADKMVVCLPI